MSRKIQSKSLFTKKKSRERGFKAWILLVAIFISLFYGLIFIVPVVPKPNIENSSVFRAKINPQSSLASIANQLSDQGLSVNPLVMQIAARSLFVGSKLKPGTYLFPSRGSLGQILLQVSRGDRVRESIAIIPGMSIWQLRSTIDSHPNLVHQSKGMSSGELLRALNLDFASDEGVFLPDTYIFDPDESDLNILRRAGRAMQKQIDQVWNQRDEGLPLKSPYELLTLASIIEKETGRSSDRAMVAAVFINRLKIGMPLQTDPTVIYGIGPKFDGNLRKSDLRRDTPYNTYMHKGLPPTPIAMPSKESLLAAAHPAKSNALYFVAKGDGSSQFSQSLKEHELAVDRYQRKLPTKNGPN